MPVRAFITYSHKDEEFVDRLIYDIEMSTNVQISIDKKALALGDSMVDLFGEIEACDFLIPILSTHSLSSKWCQKELKVAIIKEIEESAFKVVPIVKEGEDWEKLCDQMPPELRGALRDKHMARFDADRYEEAFKDLVKVLGGDTSPEDVYDEIEDSKARNPFRRVRAEHFEGPEIFAKLFAEPTQDYDKIVSPKPTFIEGSRGSGKTMILKSLQARFAVRRKKATSLEGAKIPYFGVYCRMTRESFASSTTDERDLGFKPDQLFYDELILRLAQAFLEEIVGCMKENLIKLAPDAIKRFGEEATRCLRLASPDTNEAHIGFKPGKQGLGVSTEEFASLEELGWLIAERLDLINDYIGAKARNEQVVYQGKPLNKDHLKRFCISAKNCIKPIRSLNTFFLVDEYENLLGFQKRVLNTLIKWHSTETWTFKSAVKKVGFSTSQTLEEQELESGPDYSRVDLDFDIPRQVGQSKEKYGSYIKAICNKILIAGGFKEQNIQKLLEERELSHDGLGEEELVVEIEKMLRGRGIELQKAKASERKQYLHHYRTAAYYRLLSKKKRKFGGFDDLILLSSGIVRAFLELCAMSYYFSKQNKIDPKSASKITVEDQTKAAYSLSDYYLWRLKKNIEEIGPTIQVFVINIGDVFRQKLLKHLSEPEAARISITDPANLESLQVPIPDKTGGGEFSLTQILDTAVEHSVLHEYGGRGGRRPRHTESEQSRDYILNRVFAPVLKFSPRPRWQTSLRSSEIRELLDYRTRGRIKKILMARVSTEPESPLLERKSDTPPDEDV